MVIGGNKLRVLREGLGFTMRDVETASERIARRRDNEDFFIPISRLSDFETNGVIPSIYRMYSLAVIYRIESSEIFSFYGVSFDSPQHVSPVGTGSADRLQHSRMKESDTRTVGNIAPPVAGCYLLDLLLPRKHRDNIIGDIEQDYRTNIFPRYGRTAASIWFWKQVVMEIIPGMYLRIVTSFVKRLFETR